MSFLKNNKLYIMTFVLVYVFLFGVYDLTSGGLTDKAFYLQMRRYVPCAIAVTVAVALWHKAGYLLKDLKPYVVVSLFWSLVFPVCYWITYYKNTNFIDNHYDEAFAAYIFTFTVCLRLLFAKNDNGKYALYDRALFGLWNTILMVIPVLQILYFAYYNTPITESAAVALLQTNASEAKEYLLQNLGYIGIAVIAVLFLFILILFIKMNKLNAANQDRSKAIIVSVLIIAIVTGGYSYKIFVDTGVMKAYSRAKDYFERSSKFLAYHGDNYNNLVVTPSTPQFSKPSTIIMVIGESASRDFMSAYKHTKNDTTPWMRSVKDKENFILFSHAYSTRTQTVPALERALTEKNQYNDKDFNQSVTVLDVAKKAGYTTYWFSNQGYISGADTPITLVAQTADHSAWIYDTLANTDKLKYDGDLLDYLKNVDPTKNNFIVLHLMGSHEETLNRYPPEFTRFGEKNKFDVVLNYDNSLAYTDYVLQKTYEYAVKNLNLQAMLYFSDHGGNPYRKRHPDETGFVSLRVPLFMYISDEYKNIYPDEAKNFVNSKDKYFTNDLIYEMVCNILQVKSNKYNEENSLLSPKYKFNKDNLVANFGDTKIADDKEENPYEGKN